MPIIRKVSILSGLTVSRVMRRQLVRRSSGCAIADGIRGLIKFRANSLLITDEKERAKGVVSKTDIMGAYYADLPLETPLVDIMAGPIHTCFPDTGLEICIDSLQRNGCHQLYVIGAEIDQVIGVVDYADILGLVYRICRNCPQSALPAAERLLARDVMTPEAVSFPEGASLTRVIEGLSGGGFGAVWIHDGRHFPVGVISKSDLVMAYKRGIPLTEAAAGIMASPVISCDSEQLLSEAIQYMLIRDVQRLFVHRKTPGNIIGVLSLSNASRLRSGTCRACRSSRMLN